MMEIVPFLLLLVLCVICFVWALRSEAAKTSMEFKLDDTYRDAQRLRKELAAYKVAYKELCDVMDKGPKP